MELKLTKNKRQSYKIKFQPPKGGFYITINGVKYEVYFYNILIIIQLKEIKKYEIFKIYIFHKPAGLSLPCNQKHEKDGTHQRRNLSGNPNDRTAKAIHC